MPGTVRKLSIITEQFSALINRVLKRRSSRFLVALTLLALLSTVVVWNRSRAQGSFRWPSGLAKVFGLNPRISPPLTPTSMTPPLHGPIDVGTGQLYTTLTGTGGLFEAINSGGLDGNLVANITSDVTEDGTHALNQWTETGLGGYTLTIQPADATMKTISGTVAPTMIRLNGADRVTIDGRFGGSGRFLTFRNIHASGATFTLQNDASNDTIRSSIIEGATTLSTNGVIFFGGGATTGNDNNTVTDCQVRDRSDAAGVPLILITSIGTSSSVANSGNTISNNELFNFDNRSMLIAPTNNGNESWTVSGNTIYQTAVSTHNVLGISLNGGGTNTITGNTIRNLSSSLGGVMRGINFATSGPTTVSRNRIYALSNPVDGGEIIGIISFANGSGAVTVVNNQITLAPAGTNDLTVAGLVDQGAAGTTFNAYYNSVLIGGTASGSTSTWACQRTDVTAPAVPVASAHTSRNNIFFNNRTGGSGNHFASGNESTAGSFSSNYNVFVGTGATAADFMDYGTSPTGTPVSFATWQSSTSGDANSQASNPGGVFTTAIFVNPSVGDLHIVPANGLAVSNAGTPVTGITTDYDNDARGATTPDIGSDEFASSDLIFNASANLEAGTYNNVTINSPAVVTLTGNVTIQGTLTINTGGTLDCGGFIVSGPGTFTLTAGGTLAIGDPNGITLAACGTVNSCGSVRTPARTFDPGASYIYDGSTDQFVGNGLPGSVANLKIANTGTTNKTVTGNSGQTVTGSLQIQSGIYSSHSDYTNVLIAANGTLSLSADITVSGNWTNNGTFVSNGFGVTFDGAANQSISGSSSTTFAALTVSNTGTSTNNIVSLSQNITDTSLGITNGIFDQGSASSIDSGAVTVSASATWRNLGTGAVTLSGGVVNNGTINLNSNTATCGDADSILIRSSVTGTQRAWSGGGTFSLVDVDVRDQGGTAIIAVHSGTNSGGNGLTWVFINSCAGAGGQLYKWVGPVGNDSWTNAANWQSNSGDPRTTPNPSDVLVFDGSTPTVSNVAVPNPSAETIAALRVINGSFPSFSTSGARTLTIDSGAGGLGFNINNLNITDSGGANPLTIKLASGTLGSVTGTMTVSGSGHQLIGQAAGAITFASTATFSTQTGFTGNAFGSGSNAANGAADSVRFANGSFYQHNTGGSPFGATPGTSVVTFQTGSTAQYFTATGFDADGRTYADLIIGSSTTPVAATASGAGDFQFDDLTINNTASIDSSLSFTGSATNTVNIRGNIRSTGVGIGAAATIANVTIGSGSGGIQIAKPGNGTITFNNSGNSRSILFQSNATVVAGTTLELGRILQMGFPTANGVLTVNGNLTPNVGAAGYVVGYVKKTFAAAGVKTFEVGTPNGYSPVSVDATAGTFPADFSATAHQGQLPSIHGSGVNALQRYWTLNATGITANLTFTYLAGAPPTGDIVGTPASYVFFRSSSGTLTSFAPASAPTSTSATLNGVSSFSDWSLAEAAAVTPGTFQFVGAPYTDSETNTTHTKTITVSRTGGSDGAVDVTYATSAGTATAGSDYVETTATLHWDDGDSANKTFDITVNGDTTYEANETVNITLSSPTNGATITPPNATTLTVTNDDPVPANATLVVNTTDDSDFGACVTAHCSLREAINAANSLPDANTINFNIPNIDPNFAAGVYTIRPATQLPTVLTNITIDGSSQTSIADTNPNGPEIVLNGSLSTGAVGLLVSGDNNTIKGLVVNGFGNGGILISHNNDQTPSNNQILNNYVGTNAAGTAAVANTGIGIDIHGFGSPSSQATGNTVQGNVISGNSDAGLGLCDAATTTVSGNFIGTDRTGASDVHNGSHGILLQCAGDLNNTFQSNTIAFNLGDGIRDVGVGTGHLGNKFTQNSIFGNTGLGINLIPNAGVDGVTPNDTGDPDTGANGLQNFPIITSAKVTGPTKTIKGTLNSIASQTFTIEFFANTVCDGTNGEGKTYLGSTPVTTDGSGNGSFTFHPGSLVVGDVITATATDSSNNTSEFSACFTTVAGTPGTLQFSTGNTNDTELNASTHLVTITVTRTGGTDGDVSVHYATSDGTATAGSDYDSASGDLNWLEGDGTSKSFDVTIHGDTTYEANETVNLTLSNAQVAALGSPSSATITIVNDDAPGTTLVVNTTDDNDFGGCLVAHCSLREAINAANFSSDANTINFNIPTSDLNRNVTTGVFTISPGSALPTLTKPVTIDGYSQTPCSGNPAPCSQANTQPTGSDAVLLIEIDGTNAGGYGLRLSASNSTIKGLVINRSGQSEIEVTGASDVIAGNFLGTDAAGTADLGSTVRSGVEVNAANGNTIGGANAADRNVISGGNGFGIFLINGASGNTVQNNYVGTDKSGTLDRGNVEAGVLIDNRTNNAIRGNLISGNDGDGIQIRNNAAGGTANVIEGNLIGTKADGTTALGNGGDGLEDQRTIAGSSGGNTIGGTAVGAANTIAFNGGDGVFVNSSDPAFISGTSIRGNSIHSNTGLGIDLSPDGVTANDSLDPDTGANGLQNFPVIKTAIVGGGPNTIRGTLNSVPSQTFTIDLYRNPTCDASGNGEGKIYLGSTTVTTGANGDGLWSFSSAGVPAGEFITATATDASGNTSEFSACFAATTFSPGTISFSQANTDSTETNSSSHTVDITVTRTGGSDGAVSVDYAVTNGTATTFDNDYSVSPASGTFNWANGNSAPKTITVTVNGDTKFETDETVNLTLSNVTGGAALGTNPATLTIKNDDAQPAISIDDVSHSEGNAGTTDYDFTVSLSNASYQTITVTAATTDDTAQTSNSDYSPVNTPLTFTPDQTTKHVHVLVNGDLSVESNEQFFVDLSSESNASVVKRRGVGTIINDDTNVTIAVSTAAVAEDGATNLVYTFTRNPLTSGPVTVNFSVGGTADFGTDYTQTGAATFTTTSGTVVIPNGSTTATVTIDPTPDLTVEPDETAILTVTSGAGYNVGTTSSATGTITNDDTDITVSVSPTAVAEDDPVLNPVMVYTFTRSGVTSGAITVNFSVGGTATYPSDYAVSGATTFTASSGTVDFGDGVTSVMVTIDPNTDAVYELNETAILTVTSGTGYNPGTPASATGTINNNDTAPTLSIGDKIAFEGTTGGPTTPFVFNVTRTGNTQVAATVNFVTADGTTNPATGGASCTPGVDYITQNGMLTFPASAGPNSQTITILVCKDATVESNETFFVELSGETDATITDGEGRGTIQNDDSPGTVLVVNTTDDHVVGPCDTLPTGDCTLREAITALNGSVGSAAVGIGFAIPASDSRHFYYADDGVAGQVTNDVTHVLPTSASNDTTIVGIDPDWPHSWWSILPTSSLPPITHGVVIDGSTQTGWIANTLTTGDNAVLRIELNGVSAGGSATGLTLGTSTSNVTGLVTNRFSNHGLDLQGGTSNSVVGNFIGTDVSGTLDLGNTVNGISTTGNSLTIGGSTPADVNLISGNNAAGVAFSNSNSDLVLGNLIGTKANGTSALGNGGVGISYTGAGSGFNTIGGTQPGDGNTIAFNGDDGVQLSATAGVGNAIRGNSIYSNGTTNLHLGIDLGADGVNINDAKDPDAGANKQQNFPMITSALVTGSTRTITGTLNSTVGDTFTIDFYQNATCDTAGNGEGKTYLGTITTGVTDSNGDVSFTFHPAVLTIGQVVTATATSTGASFSTSEFSACAPVTDGSSGAGDVQFTSATYTVPENVAGQTVGITLTRVGGSNGSISATFTTSNGTATAGADYTNATQTVTFLEGEISKTINVTIIDDSTYEGNETVSLSLGATSINRPQLDGPAGDPHAAVLTITENDPQPSFKIDDVTHSEGNSGTTAYTFTVTKTGSTAVNATVDYATVNGTATAPSDFTAIAATILTFLPADTTKQFTVLVNGDTTVEPDEVFTVHLSNPVNATISDADGTGTITNDDTDLSVAVSPAAVAEDGVANLVYTFTRSGVTTGALTVNFSVGGTATFATDYTQSGAATFGASSGTVIFGAGNSTATVTIDPTPDVLFEPNETVILTVTSGTGYNVASPSAATGTINNDDAAGGIIRFSSATYNTTESSGVVAITVQRVGDTSAAATVDYATPDDSDASSVTPCAAISGLASPRCDFTTAIGTLRWSAGDGAAKTFNVLISQDNYVEGPETLTLTLSNLTGGAVLGVPSTATLTIADDATEPAANPIDDASNFVRQQYHDFLNREPDASGLAFWTNEITSCGSNQQCIDFKRVQVSAAFYISIEFQDTGYLVERLYKASYGDVNGISTFGGSHTLKVPVVRFSEFLPDTQEIGQGVVVGQGNWQQQLETNKQAFADKFVQRARFLAAFPLSMTPAQFVDTLNTNAGNPLSPAERNQLVADLTSNNKTRAQVLRAVAEDSDLVSAEFNRAFVLMQYFGYLRRNPNSAPDSNYSGYDFWLTKLNQFNGNFQNADMVKSFLVSGEYRNRSGQ